METQKFKTTINCSGCLVKVTPILNQVVGEDNWEVDIQNPNKTLTVATDDIVPEEQIIQAIKKVGFKAEKIN